MLYAIASWLESPNNEALLLAEYDEKCMKVVAESCILASELLKNAANEVDNIEPPEESKITPESIEQLASLANVFDASGDPELKKQASVLDELLLGIAAPAGAVKAAQVNENNRIEELKKKYNKVHDSLNESNKIIEAVSAVQKSPMTKEYRVLEAPLSTRTCVEHPGAQLSRVAENTYQCELDKKIFNYETGYTLNNGSKVPGSDVSEQTPKVTPTMHSMFDTRTGRLGGN